MKKSKNNMKLFHNKTGGYTFIEVLMAVAIFSFVLTITTTITVNFYNAQKKERIRNLLIEETQFLANRIANLIRNNTVDYAEYFAQSRKGNGSFPWITHDADFEYGKFPKEYEWHFYYVENCGAFDNPFSSPPNCVRENPNNFWEGFFSTNADNGNAESDPPIPNNDNAAETTLQSVQDDTSLKPHLQRELYLISSDGLTKTVLRRMDNDIDDDLDGNVDEDSTAFWRAGTDGNTDGGERLGILELVANTDYYNLSESSGTPDEPEPDGILDFEGEANNFQENDPDTITIEDFISISPRSIDITNLQFFISPLDDPRKAFAETDVDTQIQPHITMLITTRPGQRFLRQLPGEAFEISLQTTVVSRTLSNVLFPDP